MDSLKQQLERKRKQMEYGVKVLHNKYSEGYTKAIDDVLELVGDLEKHSKAGHEIATEIEHSLCRKDGRLDELRFQRWVKIDKLLGDEK